MKKTKWWFLWLACNLITGALCCLSYEKYYFGEWGVIEHTIAIIIIMVCFGVSISLYYYKLNDWDD